VRVRRITEFMAKCFWGRIESYLDQYSYSHLQSRDATCRVSWKLIEKQGFSTGFRKMHQNCRFLILSNVKRIVLVVISLTTRATLDNIPTRMLSVH
jgi:hypothetical protein